MSARLTGAAAFVLVALTVAAACGKKGNPLPPLRPVPSRISDLTARRIDDRIELRFTVPEANADGTTPAAITRLEIYRAPTAVGATTPSAGAIVGDARNLHSEIRVRVEETPPPAGAKPDPTPVAGARTSFVDRVETASVGTAVTWSYVVVGVAGRSRRGTPSPVVTVPLTVVPPPPDALSATHDETSILVSWQVTGTGRSVNVFAAGAGVASPELLTPTPMAVAPFRTAVAFGRERCFAVRTVQVTGAVTVEGPLSAPLCVTPVDTYPPAAPANLQALQEGAALTLNWTGVEAADLAGYVVLRGDAAGVNLQPLMREPIRETTFRDVTVQSGVTYTYTVYAVDNAPVPNVSQLSNRQSVTVR